VGRDPRERDRHVDRLVDVIIGAEPECLDDIGPLAARGDHDHGQFGVGMRGAQPRQDLEAAYPRHLDVQQHQVVAAGRGQRERFLTAGGGGHEIAVPLQMARQRIPIELVVVDDEKRALPRHVVTAPLASSNSIFSSS
jgi:hypothetical protein